MPTSTARFRFEFLLLQWAQHLGESLCGERRAFFVGLRPDGGVRRIYFAPPGETFDGARKSALAESHAHWFLYTPHADPGSGYLEWFEVDRAVAERWIGRRLEPADFVDVRNQGGREQWPSTWRVLLA